MYVNANFKDMLIFHFNHSQFVMMLKYYILFNPDIYKCCKYGDYKRKYLQCNVDPDQPKNKLIWTSPD